MYGGGREAQSVLLQVVQVGQGDHGGGDGGSHIAPLCGLILYTIFEPAPTILPTYHDHGDSFSEGDGVARYQGYDH